ncbi:MAG: nucleotide exchange factor GrpE [Actinomycetota bacterium]|nr:nucleotide exchange factor GrpE [Actinomycetota bacterium]
MKDERRHEAKRHEAEEERPEKGSRGKVKVTDKRVSAKEADQPASQDAAEAQHAEPERSELEAARAEAAEYLDHLQRLKAEFDNYRKRVLKEQTRSVELATEPIMSRLLEVLDEFELAVMAAESKPEFERFLRGVEMVYGKLKEILRAEGLEPIDAQGKPFDPEVHEALLQSEEPGEGEPFVSDVLRTGYRLKGRVLRPAGVKVARR